MSLVEIQFNNRKNIEKKQLSILKKRLVFFNNHIINTEKKYFYQRRWINLNKISDI